ncbi:helix-hairpin-helix domain-containing protein [Candidatus Berkelbacteria bacterium]|nr:helix-hairpin-helix domain-containing protein [Candidatus Berkelbacteria bacterium]
MRVTILLATIWRRFEEGLLNHLTLILIIALVATTAFMIGTKIELKSSKPTAPIVIQTNTDKSAVKEAGETIVSETTTTTTTQTGEKAGDSKTIKININTATSAQLETLNGIGPSKASAIIEYRKKVGGFKNISEINNVSGIGDKTYAAIKDFITL